MEAKEKLKDSLKRFAEMFGDLAPKHFSELKPLGDAIEAISASGSKAETFVGDLVRFSAAVVEARKTSTLLKALPVPPYDLWLPFKARGKMPEPESVGEVSDIFTEKIGDLARIWRALAERENLLEISRQKPIDPKLLSLRDEILGRYHDCNKRCSLVTPDKSRLFDPSDIAFSDLFTQLIPTPVGSESDFDRFILGTYVVFYERLRNDVRQYQPGQPLPEPLPEVAALCREHLKDLKILRNRAANAHDNKVKAWETAPIYMGLIGRESIDRDDQAHWLSLQKAILKTLSSMLTDIKGAFESS